MKHRIVIMPRAEKDLHEIYRYIADEAQAPMNAGRWLVGLYRIIDTLDSMPGRCSKARENHLLYDEIHQLQYKSHRIIFRIVANEVQILHIRHHSRQDMTAEDLY